LVALLERNPDSDALAATVIEPQERIVDRHHVPPSASASSSAACSRAASNFAGARTARAAQSSGLVLPTAEATSGTATRTTAGLTSLELIGLLPRTSLCTDRLESTECLWPRGGHPRIQRHRPRPRRRRIEHLPSQRGAWRSSAARARVAQPGWLRECRD